MRDIKFRAFDTETKEMSYDFLSKNWLKVAIESPYVKLMQYTGLKDRNEKDIYEGDIVQIDDDWDEYGWAAGEIGSVIYTNSAKFAMKSSAGRVFTFESDSDKYTEIIGNIHENPNLLGVGE